MTNLQVIENGLVPIYVTDTGEKIVNGRELWETLESKTDFSTWIKRRFGECDAKENVDYTLLPRIEEQVSGAKHLIEYLIKLSTAKEMAMLERNQVGKSVRKYFIYIEEKYHQGNTPIVIAANLETLNKTADIILPVLTELGMQPQYKALTLNMIYKKAGIELPVQGLIAEAELYDLTAIAKKLGVYSESNKPHGQAINAIIQKIEIAPGEREVVSFEKNGHMGTSYRYKQSVIDKINQWLNDNGLPTLLDFVNSKGKKSTFKVKYKNIN